MEIFLIICTVLGGLAAVGYLYEKFNSNRLKNAMQQGNDVERQGDPPLLETDKEIWKDPTFYFATNEIQENISWDNATQYSEKLKVGKTSGWVLPSIEQLRTLRSKCTDLGIPRENCYWSSERKGKNDAFYMHFDDGHLGNSPRWYDKGLCAIFIKPKQISSAKIQTENTYPDGLDVADILVLDELRSKPDIFWTHTNIEESIKLNRNEFHQHFGEFQQAIHRLIKLGYLKIDDNRSISVTFKAIEFYRDFPRYRRKV